jgi:hypothetical protein
MRWCGCSVTRHSRGRLIRQKDMRLVRGSTAMLLLAVATISAVAACAEPAPSFDRVGVSVQDGPPGGSACPDTSIEGVLVRREPDGVGVAIGAGDQVRTVMWPPGYGAARTPSGLVLLDENDQIVARVGDRVRVGGWDQEGRWFACRPVVLASASPG